MPFVGHADISSVHALYREWGMGGVGGRLALLGVVRCADISSVNALYSVCVGGGGSLPGVVRCADINSVNALYSVWE